MADIDRIKRNIGKMIDQGAPETDIDAYVSSEGMTAEQLRAGKAPVVGRPDSWGMSSEAMDFVTGGLQSKLNSAGIGLASAAGNYLSGDGFNYSDEYNRALEQERADQAAYQNQNPAKSYAGKGVGLALGIGSLPAFGRGIKGAMTTGGIYGGIQGAGQDADGVSERVKNAAFGGALGGVLGGGIGLAAKGITKAVKPFDVDPQRRAMADVLQREGVDLSAGQITGDDMLRYAESELGGRTAAKMMDAQKEQFTSAALSRIGVKAKRATPDVVDGAAKAIGKEFDDMASKYDLTADPQLADDIYKAVGDYRDLTAQGDQVDFVFKEGNRIYQKLLQDGGLRGAEYKAIRSGLDKARRGAKDNTKLALGDLIGALDDAMERNIAAVNPGDAGKWGQIRNKWRNYIVIEDTAGAAGEDAALGLISPQQLQSAVKNKHSRKNYARGKGDFAELSRAGAAIMKSMPQSGTAPRTAVRAMGQSIPTLIGATIGAPGGLPGMLAGGLFGAASPQMMGKLLMSGKVQKYLTRGGKPTSAISDYSARLVPGLASYGSSQTGSTK